MDGFDYYQSMALKWNNSLQQSDTNRPRNGTQALRLQGNVGCHVVPAAQEHATFIIGFAWNRWDSNSQPYVEFRSDSGATVHVRIHFLTTGSILVYRGAGSTLLYTAPVSTLPTGVNIWQYAEAKVLLSDTVGTIELRMNGNATPVINLTAQDTKNGGTKTVFDSFAVGESTGGITYLDDLYVCNGAGSANNNFLGDVAVRTLYPTADGTNRNLTGVGTVAGTGTGTYQNVDEAGSGNTTDYNGSAVDNTYDTYNITDLPSTAGTIAGVQVNMYAAKSNLGAKSIAPVLRSGGTDYPGTDHVLNQSFTYYSDLYEQNPNTSAAFTPTQINSLEVGAKVRP